MPNIKIENLTYSYKLKKGAIPALNGLDLEIFNNKVNAPNVAKAKKTSPII